MDKIVGPCRLSNGLCSFSPNRLYLAVVNQQKLSIHGLTRTNTAPQVKVILCTECVEVYIILFDSYAYTSILSSLQYLEWSVDSELILTAYQTKGKLEVWSITQPDWKCKINTGLLGLVSTCFTPAARHILTIANLYVNLLIYSVLRNGELTKFSSQLRITIWSLVDRSVRHINLPKEASPCLDFSPGGTYMAVAERRSAKDCVAIYSCDCWIQITVIGFVH